MSKQKAVERKASRIYLEKKGEKLRNSAKFWLQLKSYFLNTMDLRMSYNHYTIK